MTGKRLLIVSLILPFMAISSVVHADPTAAKKRNPPNEVRNYSFKDTTVRAQAGPQVYSDFGPTTASCTYQGGPKANVWTCQR
jgi:hypothetical protein